MRNHAYAPVPKNPFFSGFDNRLRAVVGGGVRRLAYAAFHPVKLHNESFIVAGHKCEDSVSFKMSDSRARRRKDKVLNTRISEELDEQLRKTAESMDVSVSQLVRRALQRTVDMVGNLSGNVEHLIQEVVEDVQNITNVARPEANARDLRSNPILESVIGWQAIKSQRRFRCALSHEYVEAGSDAYASVNADTTPVVLISVRAFELLTQPRAEQWTELVLTQEMRCADSNVVIPVGSKAWMRVGSRPPEVISDDAWQARKTS